MGIHTEKGRVVYARKKHIFTVRDIIRIGKKSGQKIFFISGMSFQSMVKKVEDAFFRDSDPDLNFGGGGFGGGGTTRGIDSFPDPAQTRYENIIIIVETLQN
jgi:hypothetical protein